MSKLASAMLAKGSLQREQLKNPCTASARSSVPVLQWLDSSNQAHAFPSAGLKAWHVSRNDLSSHLAARSPAAARQLKGINGFLSRGTESEAATVLQEHTRERARDHSEVLCSLTTYK